MSSNGSQQAWPRFSRDCLEILGCEGLGGEQDSARYSIIGRKPRLVLFPGSVAQVSRTLALAHDCRVRVVPAGAGARLNLAGEAAEDYAALSLRRLDRVLDYQPANMTLEVEAGITLEQIQRIAAQQRQWLPLDPPLPHRTTAGGLLAADLSGPMRHSQGTPRDLTIGIKVAQADGTVVKGGGKVVKNVAGYDLPRLYCGSLGTLGVIVEACFKVRPKPEREEIVCLSFPSIGAAMGFFFVLWNSELEPLFVELSNFSPFAAETTPGSCHLTVGFAGIDEELEYQLAWLGRRVPPEVRSARPFSPEEKAEIKRKLGDFPVAGPALARLKTSVLPSEIETLIKELESRAVKSNLAVRYQAHVGSGIVHARLAASDETEAAEAASEYIARLREFAEGLETDLVIEDLDPRLRSKVDVREKPSPSFRLMRAIKDSLDPLGTLGFRRSARGV